MDYHMYDRHNIIKFLKLIFSVCFILVLSACSSSDDTDTTAETVTEIPQFIQKLALTTTDPNAELLAWVIIDGGAPILMDLAGGTASATIPGLSRLVHTVQIKFEFTDGVDIITLATATKEIDLSAGDGSLSFADTDYDTASHDNDGDGDSNLVEILNGTNPLPATDCILDTSVIGDCILG